MKYTLILLVLFGWLILHAEPLVFSAADWQLTIDSGNGSWRSLTWRGAELLDPTAGMNALRMQRGDYKWVAPKFVSGEFDPAAKTAILKYRESGFEITERVTFDAHGMPGLLGRKLELTCPPEPGRFFNLSFDVPLPPEGFCYAPASFFGDLRGIREIEGNPAGDVFKQRPARRQGTSLKEGEAFQSAAYIMPLQYELPNGYTVTFLQDSRRDPNRQQFYRAGKRLAAHQVIRSESWAVPGIKHEIGSAYLLAVRGSAQEVLAGKAIWKWYDAINHHPPAKCPDWLYGATMFEFTPGALSAENGFATSREALFPRLQRMEFNTLWCQPVNPGDDYTPIDYFRFRSEFGSEAEYRAMVADAQKRGMRVLQDIVPHGGSLEDALQRGVSTFALRYSVKGTNTSGYVMSATSPEWQDYLRRASLHFMKLGVDGFRIDQCGGSNPDWKTADFPPRDRAPEGIDSAWWERSKPMDAQNPPPLRASLACREGGLEVIGAIRSAVKQVRPEDGLVLAEVPDSVYSLAGDFLYDFMTRQQLYKFADMERADFVAGLAARLEEQYLTDPRDLLRLRFVELHDGPSAGDIIGLGGARALTAIVYFSRGVPLGGDTRGGFDIGNGPFLRRLNRLRAAWPELQRGAAEYRAVREVLSIRRSLESGEVVGVVNVSSRPAVMQLDLPGKSWFDVVTAEPVDPGKLELPPWGYRLLADRKPASPEAPAVPAALWSNAPRLKETPERFSVETGAYTLTVNRRTGLVESFGGDGAKLSSALFFARRVEEKNVKVIARQEKGRVLIEAAAQFVDDVLKLTYDCDADRVELQAELTGHSAGEAAALIFRGFGVDRWQADTVEGRMDDYFAVSPHTDRDADLLSASLYDEFNFYLRRWPRRILWQSEQNMLNPVQPAIRAFDGKGNGAAVEFRELLRQPTAGMMVYSKFAGVNGWHLGLFFRQPSPLMRGVPQSFRLTLKPERLAAVPAEKPGDFTVGDLAFHHGSDRLQVSNAHYRIDLKRRGGGIASWRDAAGKTLLEKFELGSEKGYKTPIYAFGDPFASYMMMEEEGRLKLRFFSRPRDPGRHGPPPAFATVTGYTFDGTASFGFSSSFLRIGSMPAKGEAFGWKAAAGDPALFTGGTLLPVAVGGSDFPYRRWRTVNTVFSLTGAEPVRKAAEPLLDFPGWREPGYPHDFRECGYPAVLLGADGTAFPFPALSMNPGPWVGVYRTRFAEGKDGAGDLALKFRAHHSSRLRLATSVKPGLHQPVLALKGEKLSPGTRLEYTVSCHDRKDWPNRRNYLDLPAGSFDWGEFRLAAEEFPEGARDLSIRFKLWDTEGALLVDDIRLEKAR